MTWLRIEGGGVSADLTPGLRAAIADPLWMLARQWQVGEFTGEDAASPVEVRAAVEYQPLGETRFGGGVPQPFDAEAQLLEARVEAEDVHHGPARTRWAAELGLWFLRLAGPLGATTLERLRAEYPLRLPLTVGPDPRGRLELELLAARGFDGEALAAALRSGVETDPAITAVAPSWLAMVDASVLTPPPGQPSSWNAERLRYSVDVAAPTFADGVTVSGVGYPGGHLDWQTFDLRSTVQTRFADGAPVRRIATVPVPLRYPGMPADRWSEFEDGDVNWGDIQGGPQDLARYLVAAFATVHGNDWYLVPVDLPRATLAQATSVTVLDSFGGRHVVEATAVLDHRRDGDDRSWRFFELTGDPAPAAGHAPRLLMPAALPSHDRGRPVEEVLFLRDEVANVAWAVERVVQSASGRRILRAREADPVPDAPAADEGDWTYRLATTVPSYYVPLLPVRVDGAAIRLQRGRMATADGSTGARGEILQPRRRLLLHEEEIPSTGLRVTRAFELARSPDGGVHLWSGRRQRPGRDPASPGLRHDVITAPSPVEES